MKNIKKKATYFLAILTLVSFLICNLTIVNMFLPHTTVPLIFCADQGRFEAHEFGNHDPIGSIQNSFEEYKLQANKPDLILYRKFPRDWCQVWNWLEFLFHPRWKYPYAGKDGCP